MMYRFEHVSGIDGLARTRGEGIEILAVVSNKTGSFREFIGRMKEVYSRVEVLEILNPKVDRILERYGFARGGRLNEFGAFCPSRVWKRGI